APVTEEGAQRRKTAATAKDFYQKLMLISGLHEELAARRAYEERRIRKAKLARQSGRQKNARLPPLRRQGAQAANQQASNAIEEMRDIGSDEVQMLDDGDEIDANAHTTDESDTSSEELNTKVDGRGEDRDTEDDAGDEELTTEDDASDEELDLGEDASNED
ncbi:hypothetical protein BOTBODRAFT_49656, partial [Botryobasidium botryosum FD-172 SS1]